MTMTRQRNFSPEPRLTTHVLLLKRPYLELCVGVVHRQVNRDSPKVSTQPRKTRDRAAATWDKMGTNVPTQGRVQS